jgi:hypothetical protein
VENGKRHGVNLTLDTGRKLAETLGVTLDWLAGVYRKEEEDGSLWPPSTADACRLPVPAGQAHPEMVPAAV